MYERFTDRARKVMQLSNRAALTLCHEYIGTEHILLGLVREGGGVAAAVFQRAKIAVQKLESDTLALLTPGPEKVMMGRLPQTPRAKKVIECSMEEARNLNHNYVGTEHILIGLTRDPDGVAAQVLVQNGLTTDIVREHVLNVLAENVSDDGEVKFAIDAAREFTARIFGSGSRKTGLYVIRSTNGAKQFFSMTGWTDNPQVAVTKETIREHVLELFANDGMFRPFEVAELNL